MTPGLVDVTPQKHFITIIYPVAQQHWGGEGGVYGRSHTLTDIIVIDQSHGYVYVTSGGSDRPGSRVCTCVAALGVRQSLGGWTGGGLSCVLQGVQQKTAAIVKTSHLCRQHPPRFGLIPVDLPRLAATGGGWLLALLTRATVLLERDFSDFSG